ncbi:DUF222 domain-containing protein [Microbispora hainanensis]|uniref:DUF222 domain-containing protein n=2 Tax=Microbispora TaxID=2005 RepID=A0ABZ1SQ97_9ACTN|nr:DUF222 domain-containing protein [Microbispora hainanensis]
MAQELALTPLPDDVDMCLAEAEELLFARDRITSALADRVGRVHRAGQARQHGHASTRCWLRTSGGMTVGGAGRLLTLGAELPRLPVVREKFATGELAAGVVEAICAAVAGLTDEQATLAEPILVDLAGKAGAAEVAKAGRHLRAVLDPDGEERDERADYGRRFLRVRPGKGGGVEGEFYLPREAGARLMALLQAYAKLRAQGDDRPLTVRQADALIALLEQKIAAELLVVVSAESLPTDPETTDPTDDNPHPADDTSDPATQDPAAPATQDTADPATDDTDPATQDTADPAADDDVSDHFADLGDSTPSDYIPDPAGTTDEPGQADDTTDHAEDTRDAADFEESRDDTGDPAPGQADDLDNAEAEADAGAESADDTNAYAPDATGSADDLSRADDTVSGALGDPGAAGGADDPDIPEEFDTGEAEADAGAGSDAGECELRDTASTASAEGDHTVNAAAAEGGETVPAKVGDGDRVAAKSGTPHTARRASACPADGDGHAHTAPSDTAPSGATASDAPLSQAACSEAAPSHTTPSEAAPSEAAWPDPPPENASARHTHAGPGPAGDCRRGQSTCRCDGQGAWRCSGEVRCSRATQASGTSGPSGATPGGPGPERETPPGWAPGAGRGTPGTAQAASQGAAQGASRGASPGAAPGASPGAAPGASAGTMPGASLGSALGASAGTLPGSLLGTALGASLGGPLGMVPPGMVPPGLLLATGQVLPVSSVHRLARTSTLVRIVMNADGQVLDMGRKVRLATPAQRRAIFARYATCWVDGCPLPATMCQIDHADNWSTGGLTDLKLLGPACQFHNRDRYQHPDRYTRRQVGEDRWAFTYHRLGRTPRLHE